MPNQHSQHKPSRGASPTCLLAIDQGTTSSRAILFDTRGNTLALDQRELPLLFPQPGWVEQSPQAIWQDTLDTCRAVYQQAPEALAQTVAVGITNQRETTLIWDRKTGEPIYNAIVWQDRRTADFCDALRERGREPLVVEKTGLLLDPYFSASKIAWLLDNVEGARARAVRGELAFGTIDSFLLWRLTGGRVHATDASNASRTSLFNLTTQQWDDELLSLFDVPRALLPEVRDNVAEFGTTDKALLGRALPIGAMAGDQHAAMVGQACFERGSIKSTYGTGCFMLMNAGERRPESTQRLLSTLAYRIDGKPTYALEGSIFIAGAAVQWLRDGLGVIDSAADSEALALSAPDNRGVYFVPALTGLGAPHWRADARGVITGLGRDTRAAHIVRAALEAQAYQTRDLVQSMAADAGFSPALLRADGGLVANVFVCQFLTDILRVPIEVPVISEATAWGVASLAGLQAGVYRTTNEIAAVWQCAHSYLPTMDEQQAEQLYCGWEKALERAL